MGKQHLRLVVLVLLATLLAGCGAKTAPTVHRGPGTIADLSAFPQDPAAYAGRNWDRPVLTAAQSAAAMEKYRSRFFTSWHMARPSIKKKDVAQLLNRRARGWKDGSSKWTNGEWKAMSANGNLATYPNVNRPGIVLRTTDLREMPTHRARFTKPTPRVEDDPFDYFQYSRLHVGLPVLLCHRSRDGKWYYVETPVACGWVDARDLAPVSEPFMAIWENRPLGAFVRDGVSLDGWNPETGANPNPDRWADVGALLPLAGQDAVLVPYRGADGTAAMRPVAVAPGSVGQAPLTLTPANAARVASVMVGQRYGWGGMLGLRDCSAMTRDILAPFGIWLPRNSQAQAKAGERIPLQGMSPRERELTVKRDGVPWASLVTMKGHVVLYIGEWRGRPAILHDIWGIRVDEPAGEDDRLIIGRVVITSMTPGRELPNLTEGKTLADRFHTLTLLGGAD